MGGNPFESFRLERNVPSLKQQRKKNHIEGGKGWNDLNWPLCHVIRNKILQTVLYYNHSHNLRRMHTHNVSEMNSQ